MLDLIRMKKCDDAMIVAVEFVQGDFLFDLIELMNYTGHYS